MFFTPGRILGMFILCLVVLAIGAALQWLDRRLGAHRVLIGDTADASSEGSAESVALASEPSIGPGRPFKSDRKRRPRR
jgi:uncharacterized membrane protein YbhN (UPF0104 family)